jgi:hypothetical protein
MIKFDYCGEQAGSSPVGISWAILVRVIMVGAGEAWTVLNELVMMEVALEAAESGDASARGVQARTGLQVT